ncbi:PREDICTED: uncharacterized protein LOC109341218 [Lupinus angustifolius]|uniref:uncharacterized protein LOC109341218 n=1 Tax=Lupinus angustifolius TaxID=3871 RepID=UPI00092F761A|nr:PREDICTED: uncharacterized protein LOC109341218 [Lupinus angustifolius]
MEDDYKPCAQQQRRLNPALKDVVRKEIVKMLEAGIIYPISDRKWVSLVQVVPKKGGMTMIRNENNELIPTRAVTGKISRKSLLRFPGWVFRIQSNCCGSIGPRKDSIYMSIWCLCIQKMPFGLCNAPTTFQRCMLAIFVDLVEKCIEVFMDDFTVFGDSFEACLTNLETILARCEQTNLVLNWEKCHFMVIEGVVLGHKISTKGLEVDKAKKK